ncbi:MAG TPA: purine-nucleoside phosphorylase [Chloroflexia bacterium]|nr:purine-nucleoside phosphorylase [Chloroflexia bacterium]
MDTNFQLIHQASDFISKLLGERKPTVAIILGSGLGGLADELENAIAIPYQTIPGFVATTAIGHAGRLVVGELGGTTVLAMQGRFHYYEGHDMFQVTLPIRVMRALGIETLLVTNAAGGLNPAYHTGDLMGISDHIFLPGMAGANPLRGPNDDTLGPRFPGMVNAYPAELLDITENAARELGIGFHRGVYVMLTGPNFETRAEMRMLRAWGADAVGMSTVPEVIVAVHGGMRVLGISTITNTLNPDTTIEANHEEVLEVGREAGPRLTRLVKAILPQL